MTHIQIEKKEDDAIKLSNSSLSSKEKLTNESAQENYRMASSSHSGRLLKPEVINSLKKAGKRGVKSLETKLSLRAEATLGIELEFVVTDKQGNPAAQEGLAILEKIKRMPEEVLKRQYGATVTGELFKYQQEINPVPRLGQTTAYSEYEQYVRKYLSFANEMATHDHNCQVLMQGILPTQFLVHVVDDSLGDAPRYPALVSGVETARLNAKNNTGPLVARYQAIGPANSYCTTVNIKRKQDASATDNWTMSSSFTDFISGEQKTFTLENTSVLLAGVMTSMQSHLSIADQREYLGYHRAADLVTPLIAALTVGEPLLFMEQAGAKGLRNFLIWQSATHPDRVAYTSSEWLASPLGQLEEAQTFGPIFDKSAGKLPKNCPYTFDEAVAIETTKTVWNINRSTLEMVDGKVQLRIENRVAPCGPTVTDSIADVVVSNALIRLGYKILKQSLEKSLTPSTATKDDVEQILPFESVKSNMHHACVAGLEAEIVWFGPKGFPQPQTVLEVLKRDFLNDMVKSLCEPNPHFDNLTFDQDDIEHFVGVIRARIEFQWDQIRDIPKSWEGKVGCTSADVILYLDYILKKNFPDKGDRSRQLVSLLKSAADFDQQAFEKSENDLGRGRGKPITDWLSSKYGKTIN